MAIAIVDYRISEEEEKSLEGLNFKIIKCAKSETLYEAIEGHPDIQIHRLNNRELIVHKDINKTMVKELLKESIKIHLSEKSLGEKYPENIILNAITLKDYFIHNTKFTDNNLKKLIFNKNIIDVKQGYTKCSVAIVNEKAIITSDLSIAKALSKEGFDILLLPPGHIDLPGLNYGFIGGCCGLIEDRALAFYGDLSFYPYGKEVKDFLKKHKVEPIYLREGKLIDRGSIIFIN